MHRHIKNFVPAISSFLRPLISSLEWPVFTAVLYFSPVYLLQMLAHLCSVCSSTQQAFTV